MLGQFIKQKIMKKTTLFVLLGGIVLTGCSKTNDFTPTAGATGEETFKAACASCHEAKGDHVFELSADASSTAALSKKVSEGGMMMPSFPNIKGQELSDLVGYVQSQSKAK